MKNKTQTIIPDVASDDAMGEDGDLVEEGDGEEVCHEGGVGLQRRPARDSAWQSSHSCGASAFPIRGWRRL